jgi:hypothetical protein
MPCQSLDNLDRRVALGQAAGFMAAGEGRLDDSEYVKRLAYQWYQEGAFAEEAEKAEEARKGVGCTHPTNALARAIANLRPRANVSMVKQALCPFDLCV